jgi:hypothetical protein
MLCLASALDILHLCKAKKQKLAGAGVTPPVVGLIKEKQFSVS